LKVIILVELLIVEYREQSISVIALHK